MDTATCFGVHYSPENNCLISHGECEITRLTLQGEIQWSTSGGDIFTEGFALFPDHIDVIDFNHNQYRIDVDTGKIELL